MKLSDVTAHLQFMSEWGKDSFVHWLGHNILRTQEPKAVTGEQMELKTRLEKNGARRQGWRKNSGQKQKDKARGQ